MAMWIGILIVFAKFWRWLIVSSSLCCYLNQANHIKAILGPWGLLKDVGGGPRELQPDDVWRVMGVSLFIGWVLKWSLWELLGGVTVIKSLKDTCCIMLYLIFGCKYSKKQNICLEHKAMRYWCYERRWNVLGDQRFSGSSFEFSVVAGQRYFAWGNNLRNFVDGFCRGWVPSEAFHRPTGWAWGKTKRFKESVYMIDMIDKRRTNLWW